MLPWVLVLKSPCQDVVIDVDTTWAAGSHTVDTLLVQSGATLTLESDWATGTGATIVATTITVESGGVISADGEGFPSSEGPSQGTLESGAGHGGRGGQGDTGTPGDPYGSAATPSTLGSGSENGGAGGGAIRLIVSGTLDVDGEIRSHGTQSATGNGGGAGGSIWVTTNAFSGSGSILAQGGAPGATGFYGNRGGGGGGRIAVHFDTSTFSGTIEARGGADGWGNPGEDGTVGLFDSGTPGGVHLHTGHDYRFEAVDATAGEIEFDNITLVGSTVTVDTSITSLSVTQSLTIAEGAEPSSLTLFGDQGTLAISAASITVGSNCTVQVDGKGHQGNQGPSQGTLESGAGHGGRGGKGDTGTPGEPFGSAVKPVTWGSGSENGGAGGGAIRLEISGSFILDGTLSANGTQPETGNGGGAGGSVWVTTNAFSGSGSILAQGGAPGKTGFYGDRGGGGGGRIAVYCQTLGFSGTAEALGGNDGWGNPGEPGTVGFFLGSGRSDLDLVAGHSWRFQSNDATQGVITYGNIQMEDSQSTVTAGVIEIRAQGEIALSGTSQLIPYDDVGLITLAAENIHVGNSCAIHTNGKGYLAAQGPGTCAYNGGAGHGGRGGDSVLGPQGGGIYGSAMQPRDPGSGSSVAGGGVIHLSATDNLTVDGSVTCNGKGTSDGGGGAGGSVWISCFTLAGSGTIQANGSRGGCCSGQKGGGGGGRVAIYHANNAFAGVAQASGGLDSANRPSGEDGTVHWIREIPIRIGDTIDATALPFSFDGYRLDWDGNSPQTVLVRLTPDEGLLSMWSLRGAFGQMPDTGEETWRGMGPTTHDPPALEMIVPLQQPGSTYFSIHNLLDTASARDYQIQCVAVDRYVSPLPMDAISNMGTTTKTLVGGGFEPGMTVELRNDLGVIDSDTPASESSTQFSTSFYPYDAAPQLADVAVIWPDLDEIVLEDAIEIIEGSQGVLGVALSVPEVMRPFRTYTLWITVRNSGHSNVRAPILRLTSEQNLGMRAYAEEPFVRGPLLLLAAPEQSPVGIIPPGTWFRFPVQFMAEGGAHDPVGFTLDQMDENDETGIWDPLKDEARPDSWPEEAWDVIWDRVTQQLGDTWGGFSATMRDHAQYLYDHGAFTRDVQRLLFLAMADACGHTGISGPYSVAVDARAGTPGIPLSFDRQFNNTLNTRYSDGPIGRGWTHNFLWHLDVDGDVARVFLPGGYTRRYIQSGKGEWQSERGDWGHFAPVSGGYELTYFDRITYAFDTSGKLTQVRDRNNQAITLTYTGDDLTQISHTCGDTFQLTYSNGRIDTVTDHTGRQTTYSYTDGALTSVTQPNTGTTSYSYTPEHAMESVTFPDGTQTLFTYDAQGRVSTRTLSAGQQALTYTYPTLGTVVLEDDPGATFIHTYGPFGEMLKFIGPDQGVATMTWNGHGQLTRFQEPDGANFERDYDTAGHMTEFSLPDGNRTLLGWETARSLLRWIRDARWGGLDYTYDNVGNLIQTQFPDGSSLDCTYTVEGWVDQVTNRRGDAINFTHDTSGAVTERAVDNGDTYTITRDAAHRPTTITGLAHGTTTVSYNDLDQITSISYPSGHGLTFDYDLAGNRTRLTYDDGFQVNYLYDPQGRLRELQDQSNQTIVQYTYDAAGNLETETRRNGISTEYTHDSNGWLTHITHYAPDRSVLEFFEYTYDAVGQVTQMTSSAGDTTYQYDTVGNLIEAVYSDGSTEHFTYDAVGNRITATQDSATDVYLSNSLNQYTRINESELQYDLDGNLSEDESHTYAFNTENHLISVDASGPTPSSYGYDASMNLTEWTHGGTTTHFLINPRGLPKLVAEYDASDQLVARYLYGMGLTARVDASGNLQFFQFDQQGHTRMLTDASGAVINQYDYWAFGTDRGSTQTTDQPFRFGGAYGLLTDPQGLVHARARTYSPSLGRFLSPDPISVAGGINLYTYAQNDPINLSDPTGCIPNAFHEARGILPWLYPSEEHNTTILTEAFRTARDIVNNIGSILTGGINLSTDPVDHGIDYAKDKASGWVEDQRFDQKIGGFLDYHTGSGGKNGGTGPGGTTGGNTPGGNDSPNTPPPPGSTYGGITLNPDIITGAAFNQLTGGTGSIVLPNDPNEKVGPTGEGAEHYMTRARTFPYTIFFENVSTASAPAQEVFVTDTLNANLDESTLQLTEIAWGDVVISIPPESASYTGQVTVPDYRDNGQSLIVDLDASLDVDTGELMWTFRSLDPLTLDLPEDALAGFLPPNDDSGRGEGHVCFTIQPRVDVPDGTVITNDARIVFDTQPPIDTNEVFNTIGIWVHPDLMAALNAWRVGELCGQSDPSIQHFVEFVNRGYACD